MEGSPRNALGVVASGLDVVYPPEHADLWQSVAVHGLLLSETPLGARPEAHRFPMRNRILAALSEVVVVVESAVTGGSMSTVREAERRGVDVMAVPGRPGVRTSEGTNALLRDGCAPVTSVEDVFVALGLDTRRSRPRSDVRPAPVGVEQCVVAALANQPGTIDSLSLATALSVVDVALALGRLESVGWVSQAGAWWELLPSVHSG
jgi:DNA processing protein